MVVRRLLVMFRLDTWEEGYVPDQKFRNALRDHYQGMGTTVDKGQFDDLLGPL